jgi:hypothetical protein
MCGRMKCYCHIGRIGWNSTADQFSRNLLLQYLIAVYKILDKILSNYLFYVLVVSVAGICRRVCTFSFFVVVRCIDLLEQFVKHTSSAAKLIVSISN